MDYRQDIGFYGNEVQIITGNSENGVENWGSEDDYGIWNREASVDTNSNSNYDWRQSQSRSGNEPVHKRPRNSQSGDFMGSNRSKAIGKMFYKTKLCCKFRVGSCPYITNCNFAHSVEELRKPPPNWQDLVAAHDEERGVSSEPREEFQIPIIAGDEEAQRSYKGRHCKKFYTEEGCPYGENCTFVHDEQSRARESVAISLGGGGSGGYGGSGSGGGSNLKPSNWKTRICNKWELTGHCPFGSKCYFAHGEEELHQHGGGVHSETKDWSTPDSKEGVVPRKTLANTVVPSITSIPQSEGYHIGVPSQRLSSVTQLTGQRPHRKWKGPDKISKIYGDWIDDFE